MPLSGNLCVIGFPSGQKEIEIVRIIEPWRRRQFVNDELQQVKDPSLVCQILINQGIQDIMMDGKKADAVVTYKTSMYYGSSGSPVFNDHYLIGLHTRGYDYGPEGDPMSLLEYAQPVLSIFEDFVIKFSKDGDYELLLRVKEVAKGNIHLEGILESLFLKLTGVDAVVEKVTFIGTYVGHCSVMLTLSAWGCNGEAVIMSCESQMVEDAQNQHHKTVHTRNKYSVFYIDTVGGKNTRTKTLFRNSAVKKFKYLCVYGKKGMTVDDALRNDGRFIKDLGNFTLSDNENPNCITERTQKVDNLDQKKFKLCLPRNMRTNDEKLQNNPLSYHREQGGPPAPCSGENGARKRHTSRHRQGKRAGLHARLKARSNRPPLPSLLLANVRSLENKLDELRARITSQREVRDCCALILTETWLSASVPDTAIQLQSHSTHRGDRTAAAGKTKGGGVCIFVNNAWCGDVQIVHKCCTPDVELLLLKCRPFYLPREFSVVFLAAVYINPHANSAAALGILHDIISAQETAHPDAAFIIGGDFNHCNLRTVLPKFYQHVSIPTREQSTLDHVYTNIRGAYKAAPRPHFGLSDHISVFLYPAYRQKLKQTNPSLQESDPMSNILSLNMDETKKMVLDMRRESRQHQPLMIRDSEVECVSSFKLLGIHICDDLTWTLNITQLVKKAHQRLYFLRRLRKFGMSQRTQRTSYTAVIESILTSCIMVWYRNSTAADRKRLQRAVRMTERIVQVPLPSMQDINIESTGEPAASSETPPTPSTHSSVFCPLAGVIQVVILLFFMLWFCLIF
ncbi:hypothetical protein L3Q82_003761 [Scortum barcoo]|uniref:Uncharacterized protein n=1 Tax=Scortum barcoo TaxID=214431 RepID=A0ACB8X756_9TELE|nr:hypothetical protein L3Q82_003761 [Scortum barcoo]